MTSFTFARIWTGKVDTSRASAQTGPVGSRAGLGRSLLSTIVVVLECVQNLPAGRESTLVVRSRATAAEESVRCGFKVEKKGKGVMPPPRTWPHQVPGDAIWRD